MMMNDDNPYTPPTSSVDTASHERIASRATLLRSIAIQQIVVISIAFLVLDDGRAMRFAIISAVAYWALVAVYCNLSTSLRSLVVRYGYIVLSVVAYGVDSAFSIVMQMP